MCLFQPCSDLWRKVGKDVLCVVVIFFVAFLIPANHPVDPDFVLDHPVEDVGVYLLFLALGQLMFAEVNVQTRKLHEGRAREAALPGAEHGKTDNESQFGKLGAAYLYHEVVLVLLLYVLLQIVRLLTLPVFLVL